MIRWDLSPLDINPSDINDIHVYVRVDNGEAYQYLGRTGSGTAPYFEWKAGTPLLNSSFNNGPQINHSYRFQVFILMKSGPVPFYGPYENPGPVSVQPMVTVTDTLLTLEDLSGKQDSDPANNRDLVIRWAIDEGDADLTDLKDFHVYVYINNAANPVYLGRTGNANVNNLVWKAGTPLLSATFANGPTFNTSYKFAVYALTQSKSPTYYGPFLSLAPVEFIQTQP